MQYLDLKGLEGSIKMNEDSMENFIYKKEIVEPGWVSNDPALLVAYSRDVGTLRTSRRPRTSCYVVLPLSVKEVQEIVILAREFKIPKIPNSNVCCHN